EHLQDAGFTVDKSALRTSGRSSQDESLKSSVLVVAENVDMQQMLRKHLGMLGHRVLLTSRPKTALQMLQKESDLADCMILTTQDIGYDSLKLFNSVGALPWTKDLPVMLLLASRHTEWMASAQAAPHRIVVQTPLRAKDFNVKMNRLLPVTTIARPAPRNQTDTSSSTSSIVA
ncbi:MAG: hypothetical protein N2C12_08095, partial [Planctomycetales bacterium]